MNWNSPEEFFAMGGYAFYVWGSFLMTAAAFAIEITALRLRRRKAILASRREQSARMQNAR
jgi:heme exporter protein D